MKLAYYNIPRSTPMEKKKLIEEKREESKELTLITPLNIFLHSLKCAWEEVRRCFNFLKRGTFYDLLKHLKLRKTSVKFTQLLKRYVDI